MPDMNHSATETRDIGAFTLEGWRLTALLTLMGLGLWVSDLLVLEHISLKLGVEDDSGICASSTLFSCKAAAKSAYGAILGLPIAAIGEAFYLTAILTLITVKLSALRAPMSSPQSWPARLLSALAGATTLSVLYSVFLGAVSVITLGLVCPLCVSLYGVNLVSGALLWRCLTPGSAGRAKGWIQQWGGLWRGGAPWLLTLLMGASLTVAQGAFASRWQEGLKAQRAQGFETPIQVEVTVSGPTRGESSAAQVVEFSDFQCPFCRRFATYLKQSAEELKAEGSYAFQYTFKHYPLSAQCNPHAQRDMHPRACHASAAAICAEEQGKFWEMHDTLFENQRALEDADLVRYAQALELDMERFTECLPSDRVKRRISADIKEGRKAKLKGTPAFYINGWRFAGAMRPAKLKKLIKRYAYGVIEEEGK